MSDISDSDTDDSPDTKFIEATKYVEHCHDTIGSVDLLRLYGLYKQATVGRCNTPKPAMLEMKKRSQWNAWNKLGDMTETEAKHLYVEKVCEVDCNWEEAQRAVGRGKVKQNWVVLSTELLDEAPLNEEEKTIFDHVKEGNLLYIRDNLRAEDVGQTDENGMGLVHWAADRNLCEILKLLVSKGANINMQDAYRQTPLHYAASCEHVDCVRFLLSCGADATLRDADNQTCVDVAYDERIAQLLKEKI